MEAQSSEFQSAAEFQPGIETATPESLESTGPTEVFLDDQNQEDTPGYLDAITSEQLIQEAHNAAIAASETTERLAPPETLSGPEMRGQIINIGRFMDRNRDTALKNAA